MFRVALRLVLCIGLCSVFWGACDTKVPTEPSKETAKDSGDSTDSKAGEPQVGKEPASRPEPRGQDASTEPGPEPRPPEPRGADPEPKEAGKDAPPAERTAQETGPEKKIFTGLTYWKDVKAIFEQKCNNCHVKGSIGPFALGTYADVSKLKALIKAEVSSGRMPPWGADNSCGDYSNSIALTSDQKAKIVQWVDQGAKEGDPKDYKAPPPPPKPGLPRVDLSLKMKKAYTIARVPDDHRCFVLDWTPTTTKYISGFQIKAGNAKVVHHVIAYMAKASEASRYTNRDKSGGGYYCPGTAGGAAALRWIGVWAPGVPGGIYPKDTGVRVDPGAKIIIQIHYNATQRNAIKDQTTVDFMLEDKVKQEAIFFPFTNPSWLSGKNMHIPKGQKKVSKNVTLPLILLGQISSQLAGVTVYSAMLHMHYLGATGRLTATKATNQCLLNVPRWDFNWQLMYNLKKPVKLGLSDQIGLSCTWNNSQANQPIVDGKQQQTRDVYWGDGTGDEMCLGVVYITCNDKQGNTMACPDLSRFFRP